MGAPRRDGFSFAPRVADLLTGRRVKPRGEVVEEEVGLSDVPDSNRIPRWLGPTCWRVVYVCSMDCGALARPPPAPPRAARLESGRRTCSEHWIHTTAFEHHWRALAGRPQHESCKYAATAAPTAARDRFASSGDCRQRFTPPPPPPTPPPPTPTTPPPLPPPPPTTTDARTV